MRASGVLLPLFSLPGRFGGGTLGAGARLFLDSIGGAGFSYFQTLPFCPPDGYGSPYAGRSSFALDPALIDLDELVAIGLLRAEEADSCARPEGTAVDRSAYSCRLPALRLAADRADRTAIEEFLHQNPEVADFCTLAAEEDGEAPSFYAFLQYEATREWEALREYARGCGVSIMGDLPMYPAASSTDVRLFPDAFFLDGEGMPLAVAGAPPDAFCPEGQMWGNPLYDRARMAEGGFSYLVRRIAFLRRRFDALRLDHFRGYSAYYRIPREGSAGEGTWEAGMGREILSAAGDVLSSCTVVAEDLGCVDGEVERLRLDFGFLATRVIQFAFLGDEESPHLPHNCGADTAVYSGTHDNATLSAYLEGLDEGTRHRVLSYCGAEEGDAAFAVLRTLLATNAALAVFPLADLLFLPGEARINLPGRAEGNWSFRVTGEQLRQLDCEKFAFYNHLYGR